MFHLLLQRRAISVDGLVAKEELGYMERQEAEWVKFKSTVTPKIKNPWLQTDIALVKFFKSKQILLTKIKICR